MNIVELTARVEELERQVAGLRCGHPGHQGVRYFYGSDSFLEEAKLAPFAEVACSGYGTSCARVHLTLSGSNLSVEVLHPSANLDPETWLLNVRADTPSMIMFLALRVEGKPEANWARRGGWGGPWERFTVGKAAP